MASIPAEVEVRVEKKVASISLSITPFQKGNLSKAPDPIECKHSLM
jgi:hypothetical protein